MFILYVYIRSILYKGTSNWPYPIVLVFINKIRKDGKVGKEEITEE